MTERINTLLQWIVNGEHKALRAPLDEKTLADIRAQIQREDMPLSKRAARRLRLLLENERVYVREDERIPGIRTIPEFPDIYADGERERLLAGHFVHEQGRVCNISSDYEGVLREGLLPRRARAEKTLAEGRGDKDFLEAAIETIDAVLAFADRYADAIPDGAALKDAMRHGAKDFLNALRMFRMLHLSLWASNVYHNTVGRFDQYMWPYLKADLDKGMTHEEALELIEEFFLTFNRDSDLYTGMQQGDNGQSLMLGGCDKDGNDATNALTGLCLTASLEMRRIDPKINLRVNKNTPLEVYEYCTKLTKQGLGFPQYANDDVVIPGLVKLGYDLEDARNYTVAACWEFIVPGVAMDIPNIGAMPLAEVVREACENGLAGAKDFADFQGSVVEVLNRKAVEITDSVKNIFIEPAPWQSVLMADCLTTGRDISEGAKYNNYGIHGTGLANAVDALAAVRKFVFEEKSIAPAQLLKDMDEDFAADAELLHTLRTRAPKMGRDEECDALADWLLEAFAASLRGIRNERGGIFRAGTGSAMYYVWHADHLGATADGRRKGERLPANFSPSLMLSDAGPLSVIRAFARPSLKDAINGGPLTLELHDTVFRNEEGSKKVAQLVRTFIQLGGHQLQLNAVNRETLIDAQKHPEKHRQLIVRVWGWSGHFVQLDRMYQDQIIARTSYSI